MKKVKLDSLIFFGILLIFIILNVHSSPGFLDSAEFMISYIDDSIIHPPSYPFYYILLKALGTMLPIPNLLWKLNFINALFSFLALIVIYKIFGFYTKNRFLRYIGVLSIFFGNYFLYFMFNMEVYSLFYLLVSLFIYSYLKFKGNNSFFYLTAYIFSIGVIVHPLMAFFFPIVIYEFFKTKKNLFITIPIMAFPFLIYLILIPLAINQPLFNWENPVNLKGLLNIIFRTGYNGNTFVFSLNGIFMGLKNIILNSSVIFFILPFFFFKKYKRELIFLLYYFLIVSILFNINTAIFDWAAFFIPVYIILIALNLSIFNKSKFKAILFALPFFLIIINHSYLPFGKYLYSNAIINDINKGISDKRAVVFTYEDSTSFLMTLQFLKDDRSKIPIIIPLIDRKWYRNSLRKYSGLNIPYKFNSIIDFHEKLRESNDKDIGFYFLPEAIMIFKKKYPGIIPFVLIKLGNNGLKYPHYNDFEFLKIKRTNLFPMDSLNDRYREFIKNISIFNIRGKNYDEVIHYILLDRDPDAEELYLLGMAYFYKGLYHKSASVLVRSLQKDEKYDLSYNLLIISLLKLNRVKMAKQILKNYILLFPDDKENIDKYKNLFKRVDKR